MRVPSLLFGLSLFPLLYVSVEAGEPASPGSSESAREVSVEVVDSAVVADGAGWNARMDQGGARFAVEEHGREAGALTLRLHSMSRGESSWERGDDPAPALRGAHATYDLGLVEERYEIQDQGLEQSFVVHELLPGTGDLVLSIQAGGDLTARAVETPRVGELTFEDEGRPRVRYGAAVAFDRAGLRVDVPTSYRPDGAGGRIELHVPAGFLAAAQLPVLVDPSITPTVLHDIDGYHASSAYDPYLERYLAAWVNFDALYCQLFDADGNALGVRFPLDTQVDYSCRLTSVAFHVDHEDHGRNVFAVTWERYTQTFAPFEPDGRIHGQLVVASTGAPAPGVLQPNGPFPVSEDLVGTSRWDHGAEVAASEDRGLVAWYRRDFDNVDFTQIMTRAYSVSWATGIPQVTFGPEKAIDQTPSMLANISRVGVAGALDVVEGAGVSKRWQIVWTQFFSTPAPGDFDVRSSILDSLPDLSIKPITISGLASTIGVDEDWPDVGLIADDPSDLGAARFLVAYEERTVDGGDIRGRLTDGEGPLGASFVIDDQVESLGQPDVGAGASEFTVAYLEGDIDPYLKRVRVYAARVLTDGSVPTAHEDIDEASEVQSETPRVSTYPAGAREGNETNRVLVTWTREQEEMMYRMFEPVAGQTIPFGFGCPGPNGLVPQIGTAGGAPHPGNGDFAFSLSNAPPASAAVLVYGGVDDIPYPGAPGCRLYVGAPLFFLSFVLTDALGEATLPAPIPLSSTLDELYLACQWVILVPGFNPAGLIFSDDVDLYWSD